MNFLLYYNNSTSWQPLGVKNPKQKFEVHLMSYFLLILVSLVFLPNHQLYPCGFQLAEFFFC